jgi:acyl carrier protein
MAALATTVIVLLFVAAVAWLSYQQVELDRRRGRKHMEGRGALTPNEFGAGFFTEPEAGIAARLRELLAQETVVELEQLRPADHLVDDLRIEALDSLALCGFIVALEKEFRIDLAREELTGVYTFQALVPLIAGKVTAQRGA